jgi:hypothetical protein
MHSAGAKPRRQARIDRAVHADDQTTALSSCVRVYPARRKIARDFTVASGDSSKVD